MAQTQYILSLSYGKDSLACIEAIKRLGLPLDRIIHAEVWATETIPADLPPMVEFKIKADRIIKERYGIEVEHYCASVRSGNKLTFEQQFYNERFVQSLQEYRIYGFPIVRGAWCNSKLKMQALNKINKSLQGANKIEYLGIASDEKERIERFSDRSDVRLPLVQIKWSEADCRRWCEENELLSPIYSSSARGGCWFCHNQSIDQLRQLRREYPELWSLLLKWDLDSPVTFRYDGHTVHDLDRRFQAEDDGILPKNKSFRWKQLNLK